MKAMILCAGEGIRLGEMTKKMPKVLLPVNGKPAVGHILDWLKKYGVFDVVINLHYLGVKIKDYLGNGSEFGADIVYSFEEKLLGTAGGVKNVGVSLGNTFVVVNGDTLTNLNLLAMLDFHRRKGALATIALAYGKGNRERGVVAIDGFKAVREYREKPPFNIAGLYNAGICIFNKEILNYIPDGVCDLGCDVFPQIVNEGLPVFGFELGGKDFLIDMGTPEGYEKANIQMKEVNNGLRT